MQKIQIDDRSYAFHDVGAGAPALLFHGFPFCSDSFWPQIERPPQGLRLILPDHRGFGESELGADSISMDAYARDGLRLLDALKIDRSIVGGVSMGGYVALALARLAPERVSALVLIDTQSVADDADGKTRRELSAQEIATSGLRSLVTSMLARLFSAHVDAGVRARIEAMMLAQLPAAAMAATRAMGQRIDSTNSLSQFDKPCLIVVGEEDQITPVARAQMMADAASSATLEIIRGAGHLPHLEQPEVFRSLIERFATAVNESAKATGKTL